MLRTTGTLRTTDWRPRTLRTTGRSRTLRMKDGEYLAVRRAWQIADALLQARAASSSHSEFRLSSSVPISL